VSALLGIDDLHVTFQTRRGAVEAVRGASLAVAPGEVLGVVGESGSGKSVTMLAAMGLLDRAARVTGGTVRFADRDITHAPQEIMRELRGAALSMIFQNPRAALNPIRTVGDQVADALRAHRRLSMAQARAAALGLLEQVRIHEAARRLGAYPHELSGGMCQRVMIAMAIACEPQLLIADEPTTGLDVTTQKTVMDLLAELTRARDMAMILITHDLGLAAQYCDRVTVMEQGRVVESAPPATLFGAPRHAYTRRLVAASPTPDSTVESLTGAPPAAPEPPRPAGPTLLDVRDLEKTYPDGTKAVAGVSFQLGRGESLGLVGESGSGKSTIARLICRLIDATGGEIHYDGAAIGAVPERDFHRAPQRRDIQIIFQDAGESLNPRFTAFQAIADPIRCLEGVRDRRTLRDRAAECAERCGLPAALLDRLPHQLSGGQRARVGIARGIATRPRLLVLDEPTAALDVSVQAVVLALLDRLRRDDDLAFLFVSHDLNVVRMMCRHSIVLRHGRIVEAGESDALLRHPQTDYVRALVAAIPHFDPHATRLAAQ
jgi:peptide/nickel transport system ATP-binding protein